MTSIAERLRSTDWSDRQIADRVLTDAITQHQVIAKPSELLQLDCICQLHAVIIPLLVGSHTLVIVARMYYRATAQSH